MTTSAAEEMTITQQGARYALGKGADFYGVSDTLVPGTPLVASFPMTAEGWFSARRRFEALEHPSDAPIDGRAIPVVAGRAMARPAALILGGVVLGAIGLFPGYFGASSLSSAGDLLLPHLFYLVGWALTGVLLLRGRGSSVAVSLFGAGLGAASLGFFVADVGTVASSPAISAGAGLYLALFGWAACTAGSVTSLFLEWKRRETRGRLVWRDPALLPAAVAIAGLVVTFALPWDSYRLSAAATGRIETFTAGNAFSNPGAVIAGDLVVMIAVAVLLGLAFAWRPVRMGAALSAGVIVVLLAQLFSAVAQPAPSLGAFGVPPAVAIQDQVHLTAGYTAWFYLYGAAIALLAVIGAWTMVRSEGRERQLP